MSMYFNNLGIDDDLDPAHDEYDERERLQTERVDILALLDTLQTRVDTFFVDVSAHLVAVG